MTENISKCYRQGVISFLHTCLDAKYQKSRQRALHSSDWRSTAKIYELATLKQHRFLNAISLVGRLTTQGRGL